MFYAATDWSYSDTEVRKWLDAGADANAQDRYGNGLTALIQAIRYNNIKAVRLLLERGANPNLPEKYGETPLMFSAGGNGPEFAALLLEKGADPNQRNRNGASAYVQTYLEADYGRGRHQSAIRKLLLEHGARIGLPEAACEGDTNTLLRLLQEKKATRQEKTIALRLAARRGQESAARLLLKHGANPNAADQDGITMLSWAVAGNLATVRTLVEHGAHLRARDKFDSDALMRATTSFSAEAPGMLRFLIEKGAEVNRLSKRSGWTPLHLAASTGNASAAAVLLQGGADPNTPDKRGLPPLMVTATSKQWKLDRGSKQEDYAAAVTALIKGGAKPDWQDKDGRTALMQAAARQYAPSVRALLAGGADVHLRDKRGRTTLTWAARNGKQSETVRALLEAGAKVSVIDAILSGDIEQARRLLMEGADVRGVGTSGETALILATENAYDDLVEMLLVRGVNVNAQDDQGFTALSLASGGRPVRDLSFGGTHYYPKGTPAQRQRIAQMLLTAGAKEK